MSSDRRTFLKQVVGGSLAVALPLGASSTATPSGPPVSLEEMFRKSIVIDALSYLFRNPDVTGFNIAASAERQSPLDFDMLTESGVTMVSSTVDRGRQDPVQAYQETVKSLAALIELEARFPDRVTLVKNASDIDSAKRHGKFAVMANFQSPAPIGTDLTNVAFFRQLGVRQVQLTYNWRSIVGDGCLERTNAGLSYFGVDLVDKLNELNMVVDAGHCGERTTLDAIEVSKKPILISHANCKAVYDHPRNKSDEAIRAMARKGGVMGITVLSWFTSQKEASTLEDLLDHFDHVMRLVGPEHVGFGSDMGLPGWPINDPDPIWEAVRRNYSDRDWDLVKPKYPPFIPEANDARRYLTIARGLERRGYSLEDIRLVLGENFLRVYREVLGS